MYRGLCVPRSRASSAFPPRASCLPQARSITQGLPAAGRLCCELNVTWLHRSPPCGLDMRAGSCRPLPTAHGAVQITRDSFYDTVELAPCNICAGGRRGGGGEGGGGVWGKETNTLWICGLGGDCP